jgi:hypothetical protein
MIDISNEPRQCRNTDYWTTGRMILLGVIVHSRGIDPVSNQKVDI